MSSTKLPFRYSPYANTSFSHGLELTFLPRRPGKWQEWRVKAEAEEMADRFNTKLACNLAVATLSMNIWGAGSAQAPFVAKADIFRSMAMSSTPQPHDAWCIEVHNTPLKTEDIILGSVSASVVAALRAVYQIAADLGLHPCVIRRKRDGTVVEFPNGGGHQHISLDIWGEGSAYLPKLYALEHRLCLDYANEPWIRWLFSQWMDNGNSSVAITPTMIKALNELEDAIRVKQGEKAAAKWRATNLDYTVHDCALKCHSIKQRIAETGKPGRPTYEFRFFDMPRSVEELQVQTRFLAAWLSYHVEAVDKAFERGYLLGTKGVQFTLTPERYNRLARNPRYAQEAVRAFCEKIGVKAQIVLDAFWESRYLIRQRYGKAL